MNKIFSILKIVLVFVFLFCLFFYLINFKAFNINIQYHINSLFNKDKVSKQVDEYLPVVKTVTVTKPIWPENHIVIPKLSLNVPIVWNVPTDQAMAQLANGVVHQKGTAMPAEKGNVFIFGHSSYFWNGPYSSIFSVIEKLENGDEVAIVWKNYTYIYKVYNKIVVKPTEVNYMNQDKSKQMLTLMTCYPIGTDWNRLIVQAYLTN